MTVEPAADRTGPRRHLAAILLMIFVALLNAVDTVLVRILTTELNPFVIGFFRALFGLLFVLPWIVSRPGILRSHYRWLHVLRAGLKLMALIAFFFAIAAAPLADVTAIAFTSPILVALGAWLFLGEQVTIRRIVAIALGFAGVLIILAPGGADIDLALGYALLGAVLIATIQIMLKRMSATDSTDTLVAWNLVVTVPLAAIPALIVWSTPSLAMLALLALQGVFGAVNMASITKALSLADASVITPIDFLRLPFVAIMAFVLFQESVGLPTWIGAGIIFAATLLMAHAGRTWRSPDPIT
ncbi:MAG: DMT family transporter [Hyphomicrobiales bacterium]|nr:DMT family transporter [Hyphomicrobiales bacterium]